MRQMQSMQHELGRFIERIVVAMTETQTGGVETASAVANEIDNGRKFLAHGTLAV